MVSARVNNDFRILTSFDQLLTPALLNYRVQTADVMKTWHRDLWVEAPGEVFRHSSEAGVRNRELHSLPAVGFPQCSRPVTTLSLRNFPPRLQCCSHKTCHGAALAETTHSVDTAGFTDGFGESGHALIEVPVRS